MAQVVIMPRQGNTVESCIIIEWKKKEGDTVAADTPVCEVETDKATFEVPAGVAGTILKILHETGDDVPVLSPIFVIGNAGEDWAAAVGVESGTPVAAESAAPKVPEEVPAAPVANVQAVETHEPGEHGVSPRARNLAASEVIDTAALTGSGPGGRIIESDVKAAVSARGPLTAAAKDALRAGAAAPASGSGIGGRITSDDIGGKREPIVASAVNADNEFTDTPIKGIRKVISDRMLASLANAAQFTMNASANAVNMQNLRKRLKSSDPEMGLSKVTVNDLALFLVSRVVIKFPYMNATKKDGVVRSYKHVHLGMAVDTPRGLMVPVIRNADTLSLAEISAEAKKLAVACQDGSIKPDQLSGSTISVTNLGNTGIESFTPVLNAPEVAILGVCSLQQKAVSDGNGGFAVEPHLPFSLTIDHAVVDGAPAAKFLKAFCDAFRDIDIWIAK